METLADRKSVKGGKKIRGKIYLKNEPSNGGSLSFPRLEPHFSNANEPFNARNFPLIGW